jgi:hypothetical protein
MLLIRCFFGQQSVLEKWSAIWDSRLFVRLKPSHIAVIYSRAFVMQQRASWVFTFMSLVYMYRHHRKLHIGTLKVGTPGRFVTTIMPPPAVAGAGAVREGEGYVLRKGQLGQVSGWGGNPLSAHGLTCPTDSQQLPGATPTCNLLRVATSTLAEAQRWCTASSDCAAFSYRGGGNSSTVETVYFKGTSSLFFMDSNFKSKGQVQTGGDGGAGWLSQIKSKHAPPGAWRNAPCAGTTCPAHSTPCHTCCLSIAPCCSDHGPAGEFLEFADGVGQLWSKRLANGSLALLFANLGKVPLTHSFTLEAVKMQPATAGGAVSVRDVWKHKTSSVTIKHGGSLKFDSVAGHDSRFVVLTPVPEGTELQVD